MRFLESEPDDAAFIAYLEYVVGDYMGLGRDVAKNCEPEKFVARMRTWYAKKWDGTHV